MIVSQFMIRNYTKLLSNNSSIYFQSVTKLLSIIFPFYVGIGIKLGAIISPTSCLELH